MCVRGHECETLSGVLPYKEIEGIIIIQCKWECKKQGTDEVRRREIVILCEEPVLEQF